MSGRQKRAENRNRTVSRRTALKESLIGGTAFASMFGLAGNALAAAQQSPPPVGGKVRRVVTGHNAQGKSCILSDEVVDAGSLWMTSGVQPLGGPALAVQGGGWRVGPSPAGEPSGIKPSDAPNVDPPVGGTRLSISTIRPATGEKPAVSNRVGRHRTTTIDYGFLLNGKLTCVLDAGEVTLNAGDLIIQRNTDHAWRNDGPEPVRVLFTIVRIGA